MTEEKHLSEEMSGVKFMPKRRYSIYRFFKNFAKSAREAKLENNELERRRCLEESGKYFEQLDKLVEDGLEVLYKRLYADHKRFAYTGNETIFIVEKACIVNRRRDSSYDGSMSGVDTTIVSHGQFDKGVLNRLKEYYGKRYGVKTFGLDVESIRMLDPICLLYALGDLDDS